MVVEGQLEEAARIAPWQLLAVAGLIAYAHLLGLVLVAIACLLVFLYFYVRRDIAGDHERAARLEKAD